MIHTGLTFKSHIKRQLTATIQMFFQLMFAVFAILKQGAAINATTAGRTPSKNFSTHGLSLKLRKNMAMMRMAMIEGTAIPKAPTMPPHTPFIL